VIFVAQAGLKTRLYDGQGPPADRGDRPRGNGGMGTEDVQAGPATAEQEEQTQQSPRHSENQKKREVDASGNRRIRKKERSMRPATAE
jgi:hypothetical protein